MGLYGQKLNNNPTTISTIVKVSLTNTIPKAFLPISKTGQSTRSLTLYV
jgi:hypothetical protein